MKDFLFNLFLKITKPFRGLGLRMRFRFLDSIYRFLSSKLQPQFVEINGVKIFVDPKDSSNLFLISAYEPAVTAIFKERVKKGFVVVDVGANIGYYTLLGAKLVGKSGRVFAFEPDPELAALLRRGIVENGFENVTLVEKAVSDSSGVATLFMSNGLKDNRCYYAGGKKKRITVETVKLDDFFENSQRIDMMKIDIEGFELRAMKGARDTLARTEAIITEFFPFGLRLAGDDPEEYFNYLLSHHFIVYLLDEKGGCIGPVEFGDLFRLRPEVGETVSYNLFCVKD